MREKNKPLEIFYPKNLNRIEFRKPTYLYSKCIYRNRKWYDGRYEEVDENKSFTLDKTSTKTQI